MKKKLSILSLLFGLFVCATVFSACSKDDDKGSSSSSNPLVGTWRAEVVEKGVQQYWEFTFNANYTFSYREYNKDDSSIIHKTETGTYEIIDSNTIKAIGPNGEVATRKFMITDGNKFQFLDKDTSKIFYKI